MLHGDDNNEMDMIRGHTTNFLKYTRHVCLTRMSDTFRTRHGFMIGVSVLHSLYVFGLGRVALISYSIIVSIMTSQVYEGQLLAKPKYKYIYCHTCQLGDHMLQTLLEGIFYNVYLLEKFFEFCLI